MADRKLDRRPVVSAGILLGAGLGGFVDGIVLHQILLMSGGWLAIRRTRGHGARGARPRSHTRRHRDLLTCGCLAAIGAARPV
jgi:hypothetical protein